MLALQASTTLLIFGCHAWPLPTRPGMLQSCMPPAPRTDPIGSNVSSSGIMVCPLTTTLSPDTGWAWCGKPKQEALPLLLWRLHRFYVSLGRRWGRGMGLVDVWAYKESSTMLGGEGRWGDLREWMALEMVIFCLTQFLITARGSQRFHPAGRWD